jgi:hypothetical protein
LEKDGNRAEYRYVFGPEPECKEMIIFNTLKPEF